MQTPSTDSSAPVMAAPSSSPGLLGTKIPSTVVFVLGILLFFMPFAELKCKQNTQAETNGLNFNMGGETGISNTGFGLAIGKEWKMEMIGMGGFFNSNDKINKDQPRQDPNYYAITAMALGIIGLLFCFAKFRGAPGMAMLAGILSAVALIGFIAGAVRGQRSLAVPSLAVFVALLALDEIGFHARIAGSERRLHFAAYGALAVFIAVWQWTMSHT